MDTRERDRRFWERHAARYDRSVKLFASPLVRVRTLVSEAVSGAGNVLEVAAGTGFFTVAMAPRVGRLVATDYADAMLAVLREKTRAAGRSNVVCEPADLYALAYPDESFDAVVACNVLHLVPDLPAALHALLRVLRVGGTLVAPTFCHDETLRSRIASRVLSVVGQPMHRRFTTTSLCRALERGGLRIARSESIPGLIPIGYVEGLRETGRGVGAG
jgi:ubiquinone/menaquinone biosynthesis C-methylase UbiE